MKPLFVRNGSFFCRKIFFSVYVGEGIVLVSHVVAQREIWYILCSFFKSIFDFVWKTIFFLFWKIRNRWTEFKLRKNLAMKNGSSWNYFLVVLGLQFFCRKFIELNSFSKNYPLICLKNPVRISGGVKIVKLVIFGTPENLKFSLRRTLKI